MPRRKAGAEEAANTKRPKQQPVPGTEMKRDPKLSAIMGELGDTRYDRMELTKKEIELQEKAVDYMKANNIDYYADDEFEMRLDEKAKVKLKRRKNDTPEE